MQWAFLCLGVALMTCSASQAQTTISLQQALASARTQNLEARQQDVALQAARLARREIDFGRLPQVQFSAGAAYAPASHHFGYDPAISDMGQLRGQAIVEQSLYDGGRRRAKLDRAELDIAALGNDQALAGVDRDLEVKHAFIEGVHAQAEIALRDETVGDLSDYGQLVTTLQAGGIATSTDLLRTRVELAKSQVEATRARQSLAESKFTLAALMGTPGDTAFFLSGSLSDSTLLGIEFRVPSFPLDTNSNVDLTAARLSYEQSLADVRSMQRERWPTITLSADAGYLNSRGSLVAPPSERYDGVGYSIGVSFDLPVLDWGSNRLQVQERRLAAESARFQVMIVQRQRELRVRSALAGMSALSEQLDTIQAAIHASQDNFVLTKAKYVAGQALASEVLSARQLVTDMKLAELEVFANRQTLQADLQRITAQTR